MTPQTFSQSLMDLLKTNPKLIMNPASIETVYDTSKSLTTYADIVAVIKQNLYGNIRQCVEFGNIASQVLGEDSRQQFIEVYNIIIDIVNGVEIDAAAAVAAVATVNSVRTNKNAMYWSTLVQNLVTSQLYNDKMLTVLDDETKDLLWLK